MNAKSNLSDILYRRRDGWMKEAEKFEGKIADSTALPSTIDYYNKRVDSALTQAAHYETLIANLPGKI